MRQNGQPLRLGAQQRCQPKKEWRYSPDSAGRSAAEQYQYFIDQKHNEMLKRAGINPKS
jgi:hypothetical protein